MRGLNKQELLEMQEDYRMELRIRTTEKKWDRVKMLDNTLQDINRRLDNLK